MLKNKFRIIILLFLGFNLTIKAQEVENLAQGRNEDGLNVFLLNKEEHTKANGKIEIQEKNLQKTTHFTKKTKSKKEIKAEKRVLKRQKRAEKFLNSKLGKWLLKKMIKKQERKRLKKELKNTTPNQAKILKEDSEKRIKDISTLFKVSLVFSLVGLFLLLLSLEQVSLDLFVFSLLLFATGLFLMLLALIFV